MAVNVLGIIVMVFLYLLVLGVGIWAFFKSKKKRDKCPGESLEISLLGNRSIGRVVGIFTTAATWIGGGFVVGLPEIVYNPSLGFVTACSYVIGIVLSMVIGGLFFAGPMRDKKYVTMMDPFHIKYGKVPMAFLSLGTMLCNILWVTSTLYGLGM
ncbi:high-affinity choline transporter 1-like [Gymnodraco acuticeps]|uniref:High-affinity choline transporter 1-like n=1 Tax=Gymnodraco acuticeps TaxID=8218 RepID=A0A6P8X8T4_GYMAC|nr:high-affinity choline transporter 1-like [Gymnodraco acuticeps]